MMLCSVVRYGSKPESLFRDRTSGSAGCRHWSARAVRCSS
jgi:hypothetical protein